LRRDDDAAAVVPVLPDPCFKCEIEHLAISSREACVMRRGDARAGEQNVAAGVGMGQLLDRYLRSYAVVHGVPDHENLGAAQCRGKGLASQRLRILEPRSNLQLYCST
jgi:hypothetical protein